VSSKRLPTQYLSSIDAYAARHDNNKNAKGCPTESTATPNGPESIVISYHDTARHLFKGTYLKTLNMTFIIFKIKEMQMQSLKKNH